MATVAPPPISDPKDSIAWTRWWQSINQFVVTTGSNFTTLDDVSITGVADLEIASYQNSSGKWINRTLAELGIQVQDAGLDDIAGLTPTDSNFIVGDGANWVAETGATARASLGLTIGTDVLAEQTIGIADNNLLEVDGTPNSAEYARFTATGLEGRTEAEFKADFNLEIGTDVLAQQTIGIADNNLVEIDATAGVVNSAEYARFTATGIEGRTEAEFKADFNLEIGTDVQAFDTDNAINDVAASWSALQKFPDNLFNIVGSGDATKIAVFEVDAITTGTTRTITLPDAAVDMAVDGTGSYATGAEGDLAATAMQDLVDDTSAQAGSDIDMNLFSLLFDDGTGIQDEGGNLQLTFQTTPVASSSFEMQNSATGTPVLRAIALAADANMSIEAKGDGKVIVTDLEFPTEQNTQTGTSYTAVLADADQMITLDNAAAIAMTIPANASVAYAVGTKLNFMQLGAGAVTVGITSDTLNVESSLTTVLTGQYAVATAFKVTSTTWVLYGNLA